MDLSEPLRTGLQEDEAWVASGGPQVPAVALRRWRWRTAVGAGAFLGLVALDLFISGLSLGASSLSTGRATLHRSYDIVDKGTQQADHIAMLENSENMNDICMIGCKVWCKSGCSGPLCNTCKMWLGIWTSEIEKTCTKNKISPDACDQITNAFLEQRWKVYLYVWILILFIWLAWFTGRRWQRRFPSYWKNKWNISNALAYFAVDSDFHELVRLYDGTETNQREQKRNETLRKSIQDLFDATTESKNMGVGYDGGFQKHKSFEVIKVERIEDARSWKKYTSHRLATPRVKRMLDKLPDDQLSKTKTAQNIIDKQQKAMRKTASSSSFIDSLQLDSSRNEVLLFHGSPGENARDRGTDYAQEQFPGGFSPLAAICKCGFDQRLGSSAGMLGSGLYFADKVSKADCYAGKYGDEGTTTVGEEASIFISRVILGCPYLAQNALNGIRRPPSTHAEFDVHLLFEDVPFKFGGGSSTIKEFWKQERQDKGWSVTASHHERFNSVISDRTIDGGYKRFHEYAIYNGIEAYPEFKVTYTRKQGSLPS